MSALLPYFVDFEKAFDSVPCMMNFSTLWLKTMWPQLYFLWWPASNKAATCQVSSFSHLGDATYCQRRERGDSLKFHHYVLDLDFASGIVWHQQWTIFSPRQQNGRQYSKSWDEAGCQECKVLKVNSKSKAYPTVRIVKQKQTASLTVVPISPKTAVALLTSKRE